MYKNSILVVGGGISGLTAALEAAEAGREVYLVEKNSYLGGRVAQLYQYFPKLCPPNCGLEINFKRIRQNRNVRFFTNAVVEKISGEAGNFQVVIRINPRYVTETCTACGKCAEVCPQERWDEFNYGLSRTKAIYLPHLFAFPLRYVIDMNACAGESCRKCVEVCPAAAVDLKMTPQAVTLEVGAIIWATGWQPYDASRMAYYGFGRYPNVITNVMMERLAALEGPTGGKIIRPSDGREIKSIAFVQCAGSRDENHLPYCSGVCCLASIKQAVYVRERYPEAQIFFYYIDIRAFGKYEDFLMKAARDARIHMVKGKVGEITENEANRNLILEVEDQIAGQLIKQEVEMVVLATGMQPTTAVDRLPIVATYDRSGFLVNDPARPGIIGAGCTRKPLDVAAAVRDATAAALRAMQATVRRG